MISVGIIDTVGLVGSVNALDTCLKTADVEFVRFEKMSGGIVSIVITGDVAAVSASIAAGVEAAKSVGEYFNHTIIARLDDHTREMLNKNIQVELEVGLPPVADEAAEIINEEAIVNEAEIIIPEEIAFEEAIFIEAETAAVSLTPVAENKHPDYSEEVLNNMTVSNLRKLAREMSLKSMSRERIKRARKSDLIASILSEFKEEEE